MTALESLGGKLVGGIWDFGFERTDDAGMQEAYRSGLVRDHNEREDVPEIKGDKVFLWEAMQKVYKRFLLNWQLIGSCVNGGGQNGLMARIALEVLHGATHEVGEIPFTLIPYGQARSTGIGQPNRSEGDGASGTVFARMLNEVGTPPQSTPGLPQPHIVPIKGREQDAAVLVYSPATVAEIERLGSNNRKVSEYELFFSTNRNHKPEWLQAAKKHKLQFIRCRSADEVKRELRRGRPCLAAGDWGGRTQNLEYKGEPRVLWNTQRSSWNHQQSIWGFWQHPTLGEIYRWQNQWYYLNNGIAIPIHGEVTNNEPPGGYWTPPSDVDYQARTGEVFAIDNFEGYPGDINWLLGV
ncbi:MAG: hypothetical protein JNJ77_19990 [Planctomycetia bacterium]|nr:hypothetical protein [Planctomycetia bacterium]